MSALVEQIDALLALNAKGAVSHPVPGLAVELLERARNELAASPASDHAGLVERLLDWQIDGPMSRSFEVQQLMREAAMALSVPASPAPLEGVTVTPIGYARSVDVDSKHRPMEGRISFWCTRDQNAYYSVPVYLSAIVGSAK